MNFRVFGVVGAVAQVFVLFAFCLPCVKQGVSFLKARNRS